MNSWASGLQQGWFVAAESRRVASKPLAVTVMDQPVVLARLPPGKLVALENRCPHRQYPLSAGRLTESGLQCGYHGWTFGADGRCTRVPGLAEGRCTPKVGVRSFDVMERDGLVWLRLCHQNGGPKPELPAFVNQRQAGTRRFTQHMVWNGGAFDALENFMDPLHTHLTHPGLVRRDERRRPVIATSTRDANGISVTYEGPNEQSGLLYRMFESPRTLERAHHGVTSPGTACIEYRYRNGSALFFTLHFTPEHSWKTHVHATLHVEGRWAPAWAVRFFAWPFLRRVARQDQNAVELQAKNRQWFGVRRDASTELDIVSNYLRDIWQAGITVQSSLPVNGTSVVLML